MFLEFIFGLKSFLNNRFNLRDGLGNFLWYEVFCLLCGCVCFFLEGISMFKNSFNIFNKLGFGWLKVIV